MASGKELGLCKHIHLLTGQIYGHPCERKPKYKDEHPCDIGWGVSQETELSLHSSTALKRKTEIRPPT